MFELFRPLIKRSDLYPKSHCNPYKRNPFYRSSLKVIKRR